MFSIMQKWAYFEKKKNVEKYKLEKILMLNHAKD